MDTYFIPRPLSTHFFPLHPNYPHPSAHPISRPAQLADLNRNAGIKDLFGKKCVSGSLVTVKANAKKNATTKRNMRQESQSLKELLNDGVQAVKCSLHPHGNLIAQPLDCRDEWHEVLLQIGSTNLFDFVEFTQRCLRIQWRLASDHVVQTRDYAEAKLPKNAAEKILEASGKTENR